ncbi:DUF3320 domain-containing protein [Tomitella gaofuii]|uniref:DUF3320 domain-containing protein n=1 Tax=Tomitella gaofuii TaxID=2760083 RepID=UPI0015F86C4E|nr:DUF3320 domain-containing protein [Tomitella gaofuii]
MSNSAATGPATADGRFFEDEDAGIRVRLDAQHAVNLALVHNKVPVIFSLEVTNTSGSSLTDVSVRVEMHGNGHPLTQPWRRTVDGVLPAGEHASWTDVSAFAPAVGYLGGLNESHPATIAITVSKLWGDPVEFAVPVQVLARNEWFNAPLYFDSLAAFVQPNTGAVTGVLDKAAEILRKETGDASLSGYQGGPERAALIAAAVYAALRAEHIRYINPPASFENTGQKIRTTRQVLAERFGTCVDLSVAYAACLEAAGLDPLLWLVDGHAMAGFLTASDTRLPHDSRTEPNAMINLVESGAAVAVDAVFYDDGPSGDFSAAIDAARSWFLKPQSLRGVVGVREVHNDGLRPLPTEDDTDPAAPSAAATPASPRPSLSVPEGLIPDEGAAAEPAPADDDAPARVRNWKQALLDLSTRNRLLNLRPSKQVIDLHVPGSGLAALDDLIHAGKSLTLLPSDELSALHQLQGARTASEVDQELLLEALTGRHQIHSAVTTAAYPRHFKELARTARRLQEETGSANLYLTLGAIIHRTSGGKDARAPLFLLPVKVTGGKGNSPFQIAVDATEVASPNYCLVEWLRLRHNITIEALQNPPRDASGLDIDRALRGIRVELSRRSVDLRVDELATVSICQFGTFGMWKDLTDHWDVLSLSPIVDHLTHRAGESFRDPQAGDATSLNAVEVDETDIAVPIPADGSQLRAIALAARGRTFVLEGPPGTGKSQTITNLIAHALDTGKTVLFVAEKQAALDVVQKRIAQVGLNDFTLDLHGKDQKPNAIRAQLKTAIDNAVRYNEHGWTARIADYRSKHAPLEDYPRMLHSRNGVDRSVWTSYEDLLDVGDGPTAPIPPAYAANPAVDDATLRHAVDQFSRLGRSAPPTSPSPWAITGPEPLDRKESSVTEAARDLAAAYEAVRADERAWALAAQSPSPSVLASILPHARRQLGGHIPTDADIEWLGSPRCADDRARLLTNIDAFRALYSRVLAAFQPVFLAQADPAPHIEAATEAGRGLFGKKKRAEALRQALAPHALAGADLSPDAVLRILQQIPALRETATEIHALAAQVLGPYLPAGWSALDPACVDRLRPVFDHVGATVAFAADAPEAWKALTRPTFPTGAQLDLLERVCAAWARWHDVLGADAESLTRWQGSDHWSQVWERDTAAWTDEATQGGAGAFAHWAQLSGFLAPLRSAGLDEFVDALLTGRVSPADAPLAFLRGLAQASLAERRRAAGMSRFDAGLRDGEIDDFVRAAEALRAEQVQALPARLLQRRPFTAGALEGKVGELRRQLDRKRGGATFRQLMNRYPEHILAATPCVFVSPASLAKFIPPGSATFDLVVFDEASQVTVAQSIGALGRGRAAIIVGDSQQMPPTAFGQVTTGGEDEPGEDADDAAPEDLDSILTECVESGVPRLWLSWHYRSQDESLIQFSNGQYYEGRLASLPSPGGDPTAGIELRRVDGHFNREDKGKAEYRTNRVEAEAIVQEIRQRLCSPLLAGQSIGVVTFNAPQRDLILDLLEDCDDPLVHQQLRADTDEGIFVKNLENVQGDERDVVLFSAAFSARPGETRLPLNFGPLSNTGGEKRFNVAITRARRKVVVYTSFAPSDIDLSRTSSVGLAHLRGYLELAAAGDKDIAHDAGAGAGTVTNRIQQQVVDALRRRGYEVRANHGLSEFVLDAVVREPGTDHWQVAVMLDGPAWAARTTAADRDLTPRLLTRLMHWGAMVRVWLPDWIDHRDAVLDRVDAAITEAKENRERYDAEIAAETTRREAEIADVAAHRPDDDSSDGGDDEDEELTWSEQEQPGVAGPGSSSAASSAPATTPVTRSPQQADQQPAVVASAVVSAPSAAVDSPSAPGLNTTPIGERDWHGQGVAYTAAPTTQLGPREDLDRVNSPSVRATITAAVRETVEVEGPIELDRLARDVGRRFGLSRVNAAPRAFITECVPAELVHRSELGTFVWPRELDPARWRGYRSSLPGDDRPIADIAPEEIVNAMAAVCRRRALDDEALLRETMAQFGIGRLGGNVRERLEACLDQGVRSGRLIRDGYRVRAGA